MKKTIEECKDIVANGEGYYDWNQIPLYSTENLTDLANKMYYEQSEQMYSDKNMIEFAKWLFQNSTYPTLFNNSQLLKLWKESKK